jgi:hypothetical protein
MRDGEFSHCRTANMNISLPPRVILKPSVVSMAAMLASLAAWLFPSFGVLRKGFDYPSRVDFSSFVVLACWYLLIFMSFTLGEKVGRLIVFRRSALRERSFYLDSNLLYYILSFLSAIGIATTLIRIFQVLSLQQAIVFVALGQANSLKEALYEDYSIGLVSLRYLVLYSASIALYRIIRWRSFRPLNIFNVLMLGITALLLGSRLILIATLLTVVFLLSFGKRSIRFSIPKLTIFATLLFLILSALNFSRNANYYESNKLSFGLAGVSEILAYLGSPFQVAIGSAPVVDQLVAGGGETYRNYVDVEENLNTNSAFVLLHEQMGYASWAYIAAICLFMGFVFEVLASLGKTIFLLPCGIILYGSAELWRLDLFHQGIFIVWFVMGIGLPVFLVGSRRLLVILGGGGGTAGPA